MSRITQPAADSFDLFLDTICNTFGGIVFLSIMVALLAKIRYDPGGTDNSEKPVTAAMMEKLQLELRSEQQRLSDVQTLVEQLPRDRINRQIVQLPELSEEIEELTAVETQLLQQRDALGIRLTEIAMEAASIPNKIGETKEQVGHLNTQLANTKTTWRVVQKENAKTMKVPLEHSGEGSRGIVLLSRGELFLVCSPDYGKGKFFDSHVANKPIDGANGYEIYPRYGKGLLLGAQKSISAIRGTAERLSREGNTLVIAVYPDSYHHFGPVRDAFKSSGMNYELWVQADGEPLQVFYGSSRSRVQ